MARELVRIFTELSKPWAITPNGLVALVSRASRHELNIDALAEALGRKADARSTDGDDPDDGPKRGALAEGREYLRDYGKGAIERGVAVIPIFGPLIDKASWMESCGMTSYETIGLDVQAAFDRFHAGEVHATIMEIDSPGGMVTGCSEAASKIRALAEVMPVIAYVAGDCCSAAYWLASACDDIVVTKTSAVGSLGCCCTITDRRDADAKQGIKTHEVVSSATPNKRPDIATDSGRAAIQAIADDTAAVFLAEVAEFRGVSLDLVSSPQFGQGGVLIGQRAVDAGLADEVGFMADVMDVLAIDDEEPDQVDGIGVLSVARAPGN